MKKIIALIIKGICTGCANVIPGLSGGTIIVIFDLYEKLIMSLHALFAIGRWNMQECIAAIKFLLVFGSGAAIGLLGFSHIISYVILHAEVQFKIMIIGFILGSLPYIYYKYLHKGIRMYHGVIALICFLIVVISRRDTGNMSAQVMDSFIFTWADYALFFIVSIGASILGIIPGISGSYFLLLSGQYSVYLHMVKTLHPILLILAISSALISMYFTSNILSYVLHHFQHTSYAAIVGLLIGSAVCLYPLNIYSGSLYTRVPHTIVFTLITVGIFIVGLLSSYYIGKYRKK